MPRVEGLGGSWDILAPILPNTLSSTMATPQLLKAEALRLMMVSGLGTAYNCGHFWRALASRQGDSVRLTME